MHEYKMNVIKKGAFIPAMPLVLDENRQFDEAGQRRLVRYYMAAKADGLAVGVHTTQFEIRDENVCLFEKVLTVCADEIKKHDDNFLMIAGVCGKIEQAKKEVLLAQKLGYDAALLSPGGLNDMPESYLIERTKEVAKVLPVIGFYLQTSVGGRVFTADYWAEICKIPNVVAIKCAAFNRYLTIDVARAIAFSGNDIALYTGNDDNIVIDLLTTFEFQKEGKTYDVQTAGGLLGHYAVWTHTSAQLFREIKSLSKDTIDKKYLTLAQQVTDANSAFFDTNNNFKGCIAGIHEVLRRQGLMQGIWCLNKEETLSIGQSAEIDRVYKMYPHLNDDAFVHEFLEKEGQKICEM